MRSMIICFVPLAFIAGCSGKPTGKEARAAFEDGYKAQLEKKEIVIRSFKTIGPPVTAVFDMDCAKLPCYTVSYEAEIEYLKDVPSFLGRAIHPSQLQTAFVMNSPRYWDGKQGDTIKRMGDLEFKRTEAGWETGVVR